MRYGIQESDGAMPRSPSPHADPPGFTRADHATIPNRSVSRCLRQFQIRIPSTRCWAARTTPWIRAGTERGKPALFFPLSLTRNQLTNWPQQVQRLSCHLQGLQVRCLHHQLDVCYPSAEPRSRAARAGAVFPLANHPDIHSAPVHSCLIRIGTCQGYFRHRCLHRYQRTMGQRTPRRPHCVGLFAQRS